MPTIQAETTPNPNSLKFTSEDSSFLEGGVVAYSSPEEASENPLARQLFSVSGVEDVFITSQFVTVSKTSAMDWSVLKPEIETILAEYLDGE